MSNLKRAVDAQMSCDALGRESARLRTARNRYIWRLHHVDRVPGRQIPARLAEEARARGATVTLSYATVRTIIEGPEPS